jgi:hypothetical protein
MKRLLPALAVALVIAAPASAKEITAMSVCGTNGCHTTKDQQALRQAMNVLPQAAPDHGAAFYRVRSKMDMSGMASMQSQWIPSLRLMRNDDGPLVEFSLPYPATERVLHRLSAGLKPFPAGRLGPIDGQAHAARVDEVVQAPVPATKHQTAGGSSWPLALLALVPVGVFLAIRRRGRWN